MYYTFHRDNLQEGEDNKIYNDDEPGPTHLTLALVQLSHVVRSTGSSSSPSLRRRRLFFGSCPGATAVDALLLLFPFP